MMKGKISDKEIRHLALHLEKLYRGPALDSCLQSEAKQEGSAGIQIPLSDLPLREEHVIFIDDVPVLFPASEEKQWFTLSRQGVIFHHDILKSAFYLLSGYQEQDSSLYDRYGRFSWKHSIQYRLGFTAKPVVNYYFEILLLALEHYCRISEQEFSRIPQDPILFLSHDIDRIRKYSFRNMIHTFIHIFRPNNGGRKAGSRARTFMAHFLGFILSRQDPYWNFDEMLKLEKELGIRSTWYMLERRGAKNSKYHFSDPDIHKLVQRLEEEDHEVGLHGTLESGVHPGLLKEELHRLGDICQSKPEGCRQHFLRFRSPDSAVSQQEAGLLYDASLGFPEHTGFRHSYALPFRLYNFEQKASMGLWHLPLVAMDVSMLEYMGTEVAMLELSLAPLLEETRRFGGVFSLLWHNCRLDEEEYPGIGSAYRHLLETFLKSGFIPRQGKNIVKEEQ